MTSRPALDLDELERLLKAATPGPWSSGFFYYKAGVNDGTHKSWDVPASIPQGRCSCCRNSAAPCPVVSVDENGETWHEQESPATINSEYDDDGNEVSSEPDWHRISSRPERCAITGNYGYEEGGVCSKREDSDLICALRNAAPALLESARELERMRSVAARLARSLKLERVYIDWGSAGGPDECAHGYGRGLPCPQCDIDTALASEPR
jgi:hypothetical protein